VRNRFQAFARSKCNLHRYTAVHSLTPEKVINAVRARRLSTFVGFLEEGTPAPPREGGGRKLLA
jgi:hypothetical protein